MKKIHTPQASEIPSPRGHKYLRTLQATAAAAALSTLTSCDNGLDTFMYGGKADNVWEWVETEKTTMQDIETPEAKTFLRGMKVAIESPRVGWGAESVQSFDNLYEYIIDDVEGVGNTFDIDATPPETNQQKQKQLIHYAVTAKPVKWFNTITITYRSNFQNDEGKTIAGNIVLKKGRNSIYLVGPANQMIGEVRSVDEFLNIITPMIP